MQTQYVIHNTGYQQVTRNSTYLIAPQVEQKLCKVNLQGLINLISLAGRTCRPNVFSCVPIA